MVKYCYKLAIKLARMSIKYIQPSEDIRKQIRPEYTSNADNLIASSSVLALLQHIFKPLPQLIITGNKFSFLTIFGFLFTINTKIHGFSRGV